MPRLQRAAGFLLHVGKLFPCGCCVPAGILLHWRGGGQDSVPGVCRWRGAPSTIELVINSMWELSQRILLLGGDSTAALRRGNVWSDRRAHIRGGVLELWCLYRTILSSGRISEWRRVPDGVFMQRRHRITILAFVFRRFRSPGRRKLQPVHGRVLLHRKYCAIGMPRRYVQHRRHRLRFCHILPLVHRW